MREIGKEMLGYPYRRQLLSTLAGRLISTEISVLVWVLGMEGSD